MDVKLSSDDNDTNSQMRDLEGRLLTIVDATQQDIEQRAAIKSLVRKEIWSWREYLEKIVPNKPKNT